MIGLEAGIVNEIERNGVVVEKGKGIMIVVVGIVIGTMIVIVGMIGSEIEKLIVLAAMIQGVAEGRGQGSIQGIMIVTGTSWESF